MSLDAGPAQSNRAIFTAALDIANEHERRAFLDQACGSEFQRRLQIERLLEAHHAGLRSPLARAIEQLGPAETRSDETCGSLEYDVSSHPMIGAYKLREQIGEGGFGVVYVAEQSKPVRRKVALKVIKPGMDSKDVIARFEAERQALAMMDHPNVARVLDAGATESGRPYFVMELVKGVPITEFCDASRLTNRQRLTLFIDVCRAVQHAHQKGIIHRDLKPSNILVTMSDDRPMPKVIDFGIAKALSQQLSDHSIYTAYGQVVGTPMYMSPEQAQFSAHDVDTRSDVYSLGVLLYELLTGTTPFDKETLHDSGWDEMRRLICEVDPPRPSARISTLKAEASSTISVHRRIDPRRLGQSLHGELDWIVMKALEKDRNRRYESASALADDVLRHLNDRPVEAGPPSSWYRIRKLACRNRVAFGTVTAFAAVLLVAATISTVLAVRATRAEADALSERNAATAASEAEAEARRRAESAEADAKRELAKFGLINEFLTNDLLTQAEPANNAFEDHVTLLEVLDRAAESVGERFRDQPELEAELREIIARTYHGLSSWEKAERQWRAVRESAERRLGPASAEAIEATGELGHILFHHGRIAEALPLLESAAAGLVHILGPDDGKSLDSRNSLAMAYVEVGRTAEAIELYEDVLRIREAALGPDHPNTLTGRGNLASAYRVAGRTAEAIALLEEVVQHREAVLGPDHPETLTNCCHLAVSYRAAGRITESLALLEEVAQLSVVRLGPDHPETLTRRCHLAITYLAAGRTAEAITLFEEVLGPMEAVLGPDNPNTLASRSNLAKAYRVAGRIDEAIALFEEVLRLREATLGSEHPDTLTDRNNLAVVLRRQGKFADAERMLLEVLEIWTQTLGPEHPDAQLFKTNLESTYADWVWQLSTSAEPQDRRPQEAVELARKALQLNPESSNHWNNLGVALYRTGEFQESVEALENADRMVQAESESGTGDRAHRMFLAMAHWQLGHEETARTLFAEGVAWIAAHRSGHDEHERFRAEAAQLLGLTEAD